MKKLLLHIIILCLSINLFSQVPNYVPTNGLVGWWGFNGNANDESGNGNNGTVNGATLTTDRFGNPNSAYQFTVNGSGGWGSAQQRIVVSNPTIPNVNTFTMSAWVEIDSKPSPFDNRPHTIMGRYDGNGTAVFRHQINYSGEIQTILYEGGSGSLSISDPFNLNYNVWHHVTISYDGNNLRQYIDGVIVKDTAFNILINYSNTDLTFGELHMSNGHWYLFSGKMDELGYWSVALDSCEIKDLYEGSLGNCCTSFPSVSGGLDVSVCIGDSTVLSGSGAVSYSWDNGITDGVYFSPLFTNTYTVTGTDGNGCENTDQVDVSVNPLPTVGAGSDQTVCEGDQVTLSGSGASTYTWDNGVSDGVAFNATTTTTYTVTGTDVNGCENTDDVVVTVTPSPIVVAVAAADTACVYWENVTLSASPSGGIFSGNGVTDDRFYPPVSGVGSHDVVYSYTDPNTGCVGTDTLTIVVLECTGMNENGLSKLNIYPNPTQDQITIDIKGYNGPVNVEVYDLQGRLLETIRTTTVSLRKYEIGIYIFKVSYGEITEEVRVVRE